MSRSKYSKNSHPCRTVKRGLGRATRPLDLDFFFYFTKIFITPPLPSPFAYSIKCVSSKTILLGSSLFIHVVSTHTAEDPHGTTESLSVQYIEFIPSICLWNLKLERKHSAVSENGDYVSYLYIPFFSVCVFLI